MKFRSIVLICFFYMFLASLVIAQNIPSFSSFGEQMQSGTQVVTQYTPSVSWLFSQYWFWMIIAGIVIFALNKFITRLFPVPIRFYLRIGLRIVGGFLIFLGIAIGEVTILPQMAYIIGSRWSFHACGSLPNISPSILPTYFNTETLLNWFDVVSCVLSGYAPGYSFDTLFVFFTLGILAPLAYIFYFFKEAFEFIDNDLARKVIVFSVSLSVYREGVAPFIIPLLSYGIAGIVLFMLDFLILRAAFSRKWLKAIKERKRKVEARLGELFSAYEYALQIGDLGEAGRLKKEIDRLLAEL